MAPDFKHHLLLLEDETESADMLSGFLEMQEFRVSVAADGDQAIDILKKNPGKIDLAILDIMVPKHSGIEVCRFIRKHPALKSTPVIFLTAKDQERDEILGLEAGADDYVSKPASLNLILARIKSLLRRQSVKGSGWLNMRQVYVNTENREAFLKDQRLDLTHTEYKILELFFRNPARVFTRQEILEHISDENKFVFDRTVDVHVKNLRIKLEEDGELIKTYRGTGYGLNRDLIES